MNVLYWVNMTFAEAELTAALEALPISLTVAHSYDEAKRALPDSDLVIAADSPAEYATDFAQRLSGSSVRWFQFLSAGRDRLTAVGMPPHIEPFGPGEALAPAVAEHAFALALSLYHAIPQVVRSASWDRSIAGQMRVMEGDTALIVGLGAIGRDIARRAKAFGMRVVASTRTPLGHPNCDDVQSLDKLLDLLPTAGVVFLSLALVPQTRNMFAARELQAMRSGAFLVNVGRGGLLDQTALAAALLGGHLAGAALDVTDPEPLPNNDPLWRAPNLVVTPHVAAVGSGAVNNDWHRWSPIGLRTSAASDGSTCGRW